MGWKIDESCGNETGKIRNRIAIYLQGRGLDLGSGPGEWKVTKSAGVDNNCIGVDQYPGADVCANLLNLEIFKDEYFDYVYSSHALEDMIFTEAALRKWWAKVKVGGRLILYLPLTRLVAKDMGLENWQDFYPNKGELGANPAHRQDLDPREIKRMMQAVGHAELEVEEIRGEGDEYSFLQIYTKLSSSKLPIVGIETPEKQKRALVVRYGAAGDMLMSTPIFRLLKEQGYHVTVNCSDYAVDILKNNPNVDEIAIQRRNQVPPTQLASYWAEMEKHYDRFVNLTGAAEDSLLIPDSKMYLAMHDLRKKAPRADDLQLMEAVIKQFRKMVGDTNYYDNHLIKGGFSERGLRGELYFSDEEEIPAKDFRRRYADKFLILWSLAGSAYHKWYPYFHNVVEQIIVKIPEAVVVSVGEEACALMERGESPRYLPRSMGNRMGWKWRQSLVMTKYVDLVVGPETGVLNAAGCFDTPKITLLSHSKHENLCKYWLNDYCIAPEDAFCHPCHVLHYVHPVGQHCDHCQMVHSEQHDDMFYEKGEGIWSCPFDAIELGGGDTAPFPICMARIHPDKVMARVQEVYERWKAKRESKELVSIT